MKEHLSSIVAREVRSSEQAGDSPVDPSPQRSPLNQADPSDPGVDITGVFNSLSQEFIFPLQHNEQQLGVELLQCVC